MASRDATTVTVHDVLESRTTGLTEAETWSLLCQSIQSLQDLFLSNCVLLGQSVPRITPANLQVTRRGRVVLAISGNQSAEQRDEFVAPEYKPGLQVACDANLEKMLIFSLGKTLQRTVKQTELESGNLRGVLESMVRSDSSTRASLMDLLDVISEYCKARDESKPFSHLVMDLYREVMDTPSQCLPTKRNVIWPTTPVGSTQRKSNSLPKESVGRNFNKERHTNINKSCSLNSKDERHVLRHPVQRAASRLYRAATSSRDIDPQAKYCCPNTSIGPEFIVRATKPSKVIHIKGVKESHRKKVVVILLNGQKLIVTCDPNTTTAGQIFEVVMISEGFDDNFSLGLAALLGGDFAFLPHETKLHKAAPARWCENSKKNSIPSCVFNVYLRVKFFMPSLRGIRNWDMKHLLYLQLRRSLLEQQIHCDVTQHIELGGLALQAEFGDFSDQEHGSGDYFLLDHYIPERLLLQHGDVQNLRSRMQVQHRKRLGVDPGRAEEIYITLVQRIRGYGSHFYSGIWETKDGNNYEVLLSVNSEGLALYKNRKHERQLHESFVWKNIQLLSYSKHYLFIMPKNDNKGTNKPTKYKLQMDHKKSFFVFHLASFHHQISMKLRSDVNSLQSLRAEFGVSIKNHLGRENKLYHIENNENMESQKHQYVLITPAATLSTNNKFKQKSVEQKAVQTDSKTDDPDSELSSQVQSPKHGNIEEHQNKENENPINMKLDVDFKKEMPTFISEWKKAIEPHSSSNLPSQNMCSTLLRNTINVPNLQRVRVKMGTKAFCNINKDDCLSHQRLHDALSLPATSEMSSLFSTQDAYVLNSSIKSAEEKFEVDLQETLSESLLEKFDTMSWNEDRILRIATIRRDKHGNLGLQVREGLDGGLYVQSVLSGGPAETLGILHKGDRLMSVNGHDLLNLNYEEAMDILQQSGEEVEILFSQEAKCIAAEEPCNKQNKTSIGNDCILSLPSNDLINYDREDTVTKHSNIASVQCENPSEILNIKGSLVSVLHCGSSNPVTFENSCSNKVHIKAPKSVPAQSEMVLLDKSSFVKPRRSLPVKKHLSILGNSSHNNIRSVCCLENAEDD